jgi:hypothetical protein
VGSRARTSFAIADGKIAEWRRVSDPPGDKAAPAPGEQA